MAIDDRQEKNMREESTPEGKLLNLIRMSNPFSSGGKDPQRMAASQFGQAEEGRGDFKLFRKLDKILFGVIVLLAIAFTRELISDRTSLTVLSPPGGAKEETLPTDFRETVQDQEPFSHYMETLKERDIFESIETKRVDPVVSEPIPVPIVPVPDVSGFARQLKLVGIVLGQETEAVIEDLETKETYFLRRGDIIRGAIVEEIEEGRVIFSYNSQQVELVQ